MQSGVFVQVRHGVSPGCVAPQPVVIILKLAFALWRKISMAQFRADDDLPAFLMRDGDVGGERAMSLSPAWKTITLYWACGSNSGATRWP